MTFGRIPLINVRRRPVRSALTAAGVAIGVASYIMLIGLMGSVADSWTGNLVDRGTDILVSRRGAVEILSTSLEAGTIRELTQQAGIAEAAGELVDLMPLEGGQTVLICGWDPGGFLWQTLHLREGRMPAAANEIVIGDRVAAELQASLGSRVRLIDRDYTVAGIVNEAGVLMASALVVRLDSLQQLLNRAGQVTVIHLRLARAGDPAGIDRAVAQLSDRFRALEFVKGARVADDNRMIGLLRASAWISATVGLLMGGVMLINTLLMAVTERRREIATLTALGWHAGRVVIMIMAEALFLSLAGGFAGLLAGMAGMFWLARASLVRSFVSPHVTVDLLAGSLLMSVVLGVVASIYPAWRAASVTTATALRYE